MSVTQHRHDKQNHGSCDGVTSSGCAIIERRGGGASNSRTPLTLVLPLILALELFIIILDRTEPAFARSLIVCETNTSTDGNVAASPRTATFSGSRWCDDRLYVIGEGTKLTGLASSQVALLACVAAPVQIGVADTYGRRAALLLGITLTAVSCGMYALGSIWPYWGPLLYIFGNDMQAFQTLSILKEVMYTDVIGSCGLDGSQTFAYVRTWSQVIMVVANLASARLSYLELVSYTEVWLGAGTLLSFLWVCAFAVCPETKTWKEQAPSIKKMEAAGARQRGMLQKVADEFAAYRDMFRVAPLLRWRLLLLVFATLRSQAVLMMSGFMMAYHRYSQKQVAIRQLILMVFPIVGLSVGAKWMKRVGYGRGLIWIQAGRVFVQFGLGFFWLSHWCIPWLHMALLSLMACDGPVRQAIDVEWIPKEMRSKWQGAVGLTIGITSSVARLIYSRLFNAKATTVMGKLSPILFSLLCDAIARLIIVYKTMPIDLEICKVLDAKSKQYGEQSSAERKIDSQKKRD